MASQHPPCARLWCSGRIEFCPEGACIPRGEALGTVGTQRNRNQPRLLVGRRLSRKASWRRRCLSLTLERGIEVSQAGTKSSFSLSSGVILFESHSVAMWYMGSGPSLCYRCGRSQGSEYRVTVLARVAFEAMTGTQIFGGS